MDFEKLITERYSVRKFKPEHLREDAVSEILNAAYKAPTGCNYQPQRILVLPFGKMPQMKEKQEVL